MAFSSKKLFTWQKECLDLWSENGYRGIANVVTGAGKTILALGAIEKLNHPNLKIKIIVPKIFLVYQWKNVLRTELSVPTDEIGCYYGKCKDISNKKYVIYVINSARYSISRHIIKDLHNGKSIFLIADECHHYSSMENFRIFDFYPALPKYRGAFYSLGLSATPKTSEEGNALEPFLGKEIYKYGFSNALEANIISDFSIFHIGVHFTAAENDAYAEYTESLALFLIKLKQLCPALKKIEPSHFFAKLQNLAKSKNERISSLANSILMITYKRKEIVYLAEARIDCVNNLIDRLRDDSKIIIFGERIEVADIIYKQLSLRYPAQIGRYHSQMDEQSKKNSLAQYQSSEIRILVSCRALDEGLNIPETDVGIILSSTASTRQRIQRLGRILRKVSDKHTAYLYSLYVHESNEGNYTYNEFDHSKVHHLSFDSISHNFIFPEYEALCRRALANIMQKDVNPALLPEVSRNFKLGIVRGDFELSKEDCSTKIRNSATTQERNYWITMLSLITVRLGKHL